MGLVNNLPVFITFLEENFPALVMNNEYNYSATTFGAALAITISYSNWHSIPWVILHGIFSWFYVIYYVCAY